MAIRGKLYNSILARLGEYENQQLIYNAIDNGVKLNTLSNFEGVSTEGILQSELQYGKSLEGLHKSQVNRYIPKIKSQNQIRKWNQEAENKYDGKFKFGGKQSVCKTSLVFSEFIHQTIKEENDLNDRKILMEKYFNEGLTAKEIKFLNDTCDIINQNIDQEFEKKKLNALDQQLINQMELQVVEDLLNHFNQLRDEFKNARQKFLEEKNQSVIEITRQNLLHQQQLLAKKDNVKQMKRKADLFGYKVNQLVLRKSVQKPNVKIYVRMFIEGLKRNVIRKRAEQNQKIADGYKDNAQRQTIFLQNDNEIQTFDQDNLVRWASFFNKKDVSSQNQSEKLKIKKFLYHPPSKLFVNQKSGTDSVRKARSVSNSQDSSEVNKLQSKEFYKRKQNQNPSFTDKNKFIQFYTGGPQQEQNLSIIHLSKAALIIQRFYRGYRIRKHFKDQFAKRYLQLSKKVSNIISKKQGSQLIGTELTTKSTNNIGKFSLFGSVHQMKRSQRSWSTKINQEDTYEQSVFSQLKHLKTGDLSSRVNTSRLRGETDHTSDYNQSQIRINTLKTEETKKQSNNAIRQNLKQVEQSKIRSLFRMAQNHKTAEQFLKLNLELTKQQVNSLDNSQHCALYYSCLRGCLVITQYIISIGGDINQKCMNNNTPLHAAMRNIMKIYNLFKSIESGNDDLILFFFQSSISNFNALNNDNCTPLNYCPQRLLDQQGLSNRVVVTARNDEKISFDNNEVIFGIANPLYTLQNDSKVYQ